jgi:hypothetical protein
MNQDLSLLLVFFSMRLTQSHDSGYRFYELTQVDSSCFIMFFFQIKSFQFFHNVKKDALAIRFLKEQEKFATQVIDLNRFNKLS